MGRSGGGRRRPLVTEDLEEDILRGGFSGGGRSSGGFSSGGGFGGRSSGRGYYGGSGPHYHNYYYGGWGPRPYRDNSLLSTIVTIIVILFILGTFISMATSSNSKIPKNTKERTALFGVVNKTDWYQDDIGWVSNKSTLISGLEDFYNKTGVQPFILFVPYSPNYWNGSSINATATDDYLETIYKSKFTDEAHFIFAYFQCKNDSKSEMDGEFRYLSGYSADTIMDNEAINILWGYFEKNYYDTSLSLEKMISNTFSETAKSIMSKPTNGWDFGIVFFVIIGAIVAIWIIYKIIKNKNQRAKEKEEYTKEILEKPLETFGKDTSDLEDKYK